MSDLPDILFHGTHREHYRNMKREGETDLIYLADERSGAFGYAEDVAIQKESRGEEAEAVIVKFDADWLLHNGQLGPDYDDIPPNMHLFDAHQARNVPWYESLEVLGTCTYRGPLDGAFLDVEVLG